MPVEFEEYFGNPIIVLKRDENDNFLMRFGLKKAQLILDNIEDIKKFVKENSS